ncbi:sodium:solute symporter [Phaeodactylibacter xiamenensis]|uniref:sodium:solute symporter n=2 Tax=Phaeodactylibacter xiamenensis TaxID=1524460 RepID=UPI003BAABE48
METLDWIIMLGTLLSIVAYGVWYTRKVDNVQSYLLGDRDLPWWTIGLSVMATQASAITFLSTPGQAYEDGMRFAQFYFGLPVAMVILCVFVLPIYYRLKVYTAYEYLEGRFDLRTRTLTAVLFLIQRGLAAGLTIYAPAIILSTILGWSLRWTVLFIGALVIFYTMLGGTKAVSVTQKQQMIVILSGMFIAAMILIFQLPPDVGFSDAVGVAGKMGKLNVVDFEFDLSNRYNFWSGMIGGVFLFLSYFGTDQSQVQRYLSGKSLNESRLGLLFNGILKVPMQFLVLFVGILVFVFFQFQQPPIHFNSANLEKLENTEYADDLANLQAQHNTLFLTQQEEVRALMGAIDQNDEPAISEIQQRLSTLRETDSELRKATKDLILQADPASKIKDTDYVFITFVTEYLPVGLVGLLLAVIFSAAMSSTASELNALATTTVVDLYRRSFAKDKSDRHYLNASKAFTAVWGGIALVFAATANLFENLIQAVNIIGSLFYGAILGIFVVAFFMKKVGGRAVFIGALIAEAIVLIIFTLNSMEIINIAYLWLNLIGCTLVMGIAWILEQVLPKKLSAS